ncbi:hypothetical protein C7I87_02450 [Mesorhizobium sp. SARCC-RB16n]|nr:hypothetical protein C7I87_02450 [Mesorhizobium sp. SARCC-RB16n]
MKPAALTIIRRTIEEHCPPGVLPCEEMVNGLYGPGLMDEAARCRALEFGKPFRLELRARAPVCLLCSTGDHGHGLEPR